MNKTAVSSTCQVTKVTFRAFDQTLVEYFIDKTDEYIHESLFESCNTYQIVSKETCQDAQLSFQPIDTLIQLNKTAQ